ncbi:SDR family oxidoreductase [Actinosynnema pretiosum subsp. pretiosum]
MITGAGTGIGRATALRFAREGAHVLAVGRRLEPLAALGRGIEPLAADVTTDVDAIARAAGPVDVLVNNAATALGQPLGRITAEAAHAQVAVNLLAPLLLTQAVDLRKGGTVINVSTSTGGRGWPGRSVYAATKAGLESLTRSLALELAPRHVRVNAVAPGAIATPIADHLPPDELAALRAWQVARTPLGRIGTPEEVAEVIAHLAAAPFTTGVVLPVDGGAAVGA